MFMAILVASAVLPIDGRPARMCRSDLCKPPICLSRSTRPVEIPGQMPIAVIGFFGHGQGAADGVGKRHEAGRGGAFFGQFEQLSFGGFDLVAGSEITGIGGAGDFPTQPGSVRGAGPGRR